MENVRETGIMHVECYGMIELEPQAEWNLHRLQDKAYVSLRKGERYIEVFPFYDLQGQPHIRVMLDEVGVWDYEWVRQMASEKQPLVSGRIQCTPVSAGNHGPVKVVNKTDFAHADGTPYIPLGTTCEYGYLEAYAEQTLESLQQAAFNKVRFALRADASIQEQEQLDQMIAKCLPLGMQTEIIIHIDQVERAAVSAYLQQIIARYSSYRHVSWSLAVTEAANTASSVILDDALKLVQEFDTYGHLRTVNCTDPHAYVGNGLVTHLSVQYDDPSQVSYFVQLHQKPVIVDECGSEGNEPDVERSLTAEEQVQRIWESICRKGYAGHSETFERSGASNGPTGTSLAETKAETWRAHGGVLSGAAVERIAFLRTIIEQAPRGLRAMPEHYDASTIGRDAVYYLQYMGIHRFPYRQFELPAGRYLIDIIDTWNMTIMTLPETFEGKAHIALPTKEYYALRIRKEHWTEEDVNGLDNDELVDVDQRMQDAEARDNFIKEAVAANKQNGGQS